MPDAYELYEGRQVQIFSNTSAADATNVGSVATPQNTVRTILGASYTPSVAETRTVYWAVVTRGTSPSIIGITQPVAIALSAGIRFPLLTQGMEVKLFPGEYLIIYRDVATAGSTMAITVRFIDSDLPYQAYVEPLKKVVQTARRHGQVFAQSGGISTGGGPGGPGPGSISHGGGGGGAEPV